ncbi:MAG: SDR family oxidoreductase [Bauldia sp.]|nr:MAG: SDR family oxidoreductase [Bauldia sp.]
MAIFDLSGRIAFVTGSSKGIGFAIAEVLAAAGAEVVLNSRNPEELESARARLAGDGRKVHAFAFDVTDQAVVEANVARIEAEVGPIDILFNNAGVQRRAPFVDIPADTWRDVMATNLDAVFFVGQAVARRMVPRGRGKIINTCSLASEVARQTIAPYTTAKGAVKMLTKAMCVELARYGIQVNGIGPGYFKTELNVALSTNPEFDAWVRQRTPAGRWGEVEELKGVAVFLASDASSYVNGQVIYVDGGLLSGM